MHGRRRRDDLRGDAPLSLSPDRTVPPRTEPTIQRRPTDAARIVVAAAVLVPLSLHAGSPTATEQAVTRFVASLPRGAGSFMLLVYDLAGLWAVAVLGGVVLVLRRWRLARDLVIAGALAWVAGRTVAFLVRGDAVWDALRVTFDLTAPPRYPLVRVAMAVAILVVAAPALTRPTRRVGQVLVALLAGSGLYLARGSVDDLFGAVVLGWGVAACVRYAFGTSSGRPTTEQVAAGLARLGVVANDVREASETSPGRSIFLAESRANGSMERVRIIALGRDEADTQLLARAWRYVAYRDAPPTLFPTRRQQVEFEAYVTLLARQAGAHVPALIAAGTAGPVALLVEEFVAGVPLFDADPDRVTDEVLAEIWSIARELRAARIAHGKFDGRHILLAADSVALVDLFWATSSANPPQLDHDTAQLLAATAAVVGTTRAVAAARRAIGDEALAASLGFLQPAALSGWTHDALGGRHGLEKVLADLRATAATAAGAETPELRPLHRVEPRNILMAVGTFVAIATLLSRIGDPAKFWSTVRGADWLFVLLAFALGQLTDAAFGVTFLGNVPTRIPIWRSIELQMSMAFSNLAVPVAADAAVQVRFLQKVGLDLASAVAAGGLLSSISEIAVQIGLFFIALSLAPTAIHLGRIDIARFEWVALGLVFVLGVTAAFVLGIRRLRAAVIPPIRRAGLTVWQATKSPGRLSLLIVGNVVTQCLSACALLACLAAFGHTVNFWTLIALNIGMSTIASLVPIPGGGTAVRSIGLAGLLTSVGVPSAAAAAAVLTNQLVTTYLPAVPGWFATRDLVHAGYL
jgi:undecaprenyl-diphosphatase